MVTILDGGMGGELIRRRVTPGNELWSAQALLDAPDAVLAVHRDYIGAGAQIITTNSYSTIPSYLGKLDLTARYIELTALAGRLARQAADEAPRPVQVAGSLPPLDESYRADLVPPDEQALPIYRELATALAPYVDLYLCETMSCIRESVNAASAARSVGGPGKTIYLSWTLAESPGQGLRSGETIEAAFDAVADLDISAYLFNCTSPEAITAGLATLRPLTDRPIGAYPNRLSIPEGWTLDNEVPTGYRTDLDVAAYVDYTRRWVEQGAEIIGGCCGIGPEYIDSLQSELAA
jgi:S-methylmethionine-dependent homocysteine/selenocysteine methylase